MDDTEILQSYLTVSPFELETNQERIEYAVKSPLLGLTKPVVVGSVQIYSGLNNHLTDIERGNRVSHPIDTSELVQKRSASGNNATKG
ncbi:hypothetical protein X801_09211 [Opisthorchis viverrini]|uniref:Uncharacterized protein n=1 Tax=Opisthorchis viverrini TaxID=6198 RepID=A0A1S8WKN7_OPIVI|nr:hypothetical protein X801_09211 [Opisthorchis viverrini]